MHKGEKVPMQSSLAGRVDSLNSKQIALEKKVDDALTKINNMIQTVDLFVKMVNNLAAEQASLNASIPDNIKIQPPKQ